MKIVKILTPCVLVALILFMAVGTVYESIYGSAEALEHIYHTPYYIGLWVVMMVLTVVLMLRNKLYQRPALAILHGSMMLIFIGAMLTSLTGERGVIELQSNEANNTLVDKDGEQYAMPFDVTLEEFEVVNYPGTSAPMDFVATVTLGNQQSKVSMNNIGSHKNYRFYISNFNEEGVVELKVTHDPWGIGMVYAGFSMMLLAMLFFFFVDKKSGFRELLRNPLLKAVTLLLMVTAAVPTMANPRTLPLSTAQKMGNMYVLYKDRVCPVQTLARDFTYQLYGSASYNGLTAEQVLAGWMFFYDDWKDEPCIKVKGKMVRDTLHVDGRYASLMQFLDGQGENIVGKMLDSMALDDPRRAKLTEVNKKYNLLVQLYSGELLKIFPMADGQGVIGWYSQSDNFAPETISDEEYIYIRKQQSFYQELVAVGDMETLGEAFEKHRIYQEQRGGNSIPSRFVFNAERFYNSIALTRPIAIICIMLGLVFFAMTLIQYGGVGEQKWRKKVNALLLAVLSVYLLMLFVMRWLLSGYVPLAGGYETMCFLALCISIAALLTYRKFELALPFGLLMAGFALMAAMIEGVNPPATPLIPVLKSPLLLIHVAIMMFAYALLAFTLFNSIAAVVVRLTNKEWQVQVGRLQVISQLLLYPAVFFMVAGIIVGSVWANISWGSYWSWDPKEVWALITTIIYAAPLHARSIPWLRKPMAFHLYVLVAFISVLVTYFGVNLILGGLHSYA